MQTADGRVSAETENSTALKELAYLFGGTHHITLDGSEWRAAPRGGGAALRRASPAGLALALHTARDAR